MGGEAEEKDKYSYISKTVKRTVSAVKRMRWSIALRFS